MLRWAEASTIFSVKCLFQVCDLHDVLLAFEEEETCDGNGVHRT